MSRTVHIRIVGRNFISNHFDTLFCSYVERETNIRYKSLALLNRSESLVEGVLPMLLVYHLMHVVIAQLIPLPNAFENETAIQISVIDLLKKVTALIRFDRSTLYQIFMNQVSTITVSTCVILLLYTV